jgi:nitroreductase
MARRRSSSLWLAVVVALSCPAAVLVQNLSPVALPDPVMDGGKPLMQVLKARKSAREFAPDALPAQVLSNLLWAAWGVNRPDGRRTAPSASNRQEVEIYVVRADGAFLWDAGSNTLKPVAATDLRATTGSQPFVAMAAVNLVYVADVTKLSRPSTDPQQMLNIGADVGAIAQNVYLFCASEGLATVVRASLPKEALAKALRLRDTQLIVLAQTVGYPKS